MKVSPKRASQNYVNKRNPREKKNLLRLFRSTVFKNDLENILKTQQKTEERKIAIDL